MADSLRDLKMSADDRQVFVDDTGDLAVTSGIETVEQSLALNAGDVLRPLIGEPIEDETFGDVEATLQERLQNDPQVEGPQRVSVTQVNRSTGTVSVEIFTTFNDSFTLEVTP